MQKKYKVVVTDYHYDSIQPYWDVYNQHPDIEFIPLQLTEKRISCGKRNMPTRCSVILT